MCSNVGCQKFLPHTSHTRLVPARDERQRVVRPVLTSRPSSASGYFDRMSFRYLSFHALVCMSLRLSRMIRPIVMHTHFGLSGVSLASFVLPFHTSSLWVWVRLVGVRSRGSLIGMDRDPCRVRVAAFGPRAVASFARRSNPSGECLVGYLLRRSSCCFRLLLSRGSRSIGLQSGYHRDFAPALAVLALGLGHLHRAEIIWPYPVPPWPDPLKINSRILFRISAAASPRPSQWGHDTIIMNGAW